MLKGIEEMLQGMRIRRKLTIIFLFHTLLFDEGYWARFRELMLLSASFIAAFDGGMFHDKAWKKRTGRKLVFGNIKMQ